MARFPIAVITLFALCGSVAWAAPVCEGELIFPQQDKHCHGSSIVQCPNGDYLACWFYGSGERRANDVLVQGARLKKGDNAWSPVFVMADTPDLPDCNPVLFVDNRERLWLFWIAVVANGWENSLLRYRRAEDYTGDGPPNWSWQETIILKPGDRFRSAIESGFEEAGIEEGCWAEYALPYSEMLVEAAKDPMKRQKGWMTRIHPVMLPSGRLVLPLYSDGFNLALVALSDDGGETWRASLPIVGLGPTQPSIVRKSDGTLLAYMRDEGDAPQRVQISTSGDDGETWSFATDTDFPNPSSSLEVIPLADGTWAMIYNDTENGRHSLAVSLSDDEGATWKWKRHLESADPGQGSYSYPSLLQDAEGMLHATYSYKDSGGASIKHSAFNVDWVKQGD